MDGAVIGFIVVSLATIITTLVTYLLQGKNRSQIELFKSGNDELRNQAATHIQQKAELQAEVHRLEFKLKVSENSVEDKNKLIEHLTGMAQQLPAFQELSKQQGREHQEVTSILGKVVQGQTDVAQALTELVREIKGGHRV